MKKVIFILAMVLFTGTVKLNAQDVIIRTDGSEIRAKVTEVGAADIKYKIFDEQDGPVYVVQKSKLSKIKYASGRVEVFNENVGSVPVTSQSQPQPQPHTAATPPPVQPQHPITMQTYPNGGYWKSDMQLKAPYLYQNYRKGSNLVKGGWYMIGGGILLSIVGAAVAEKEEVNRTSTYVEYKLKGPGAAVAMVGSIAATAGIPVVIVGYVKRNRAKRDFFNSYQRVEKSPAQSPHFELRTNGLAFVF
jgi:hypothetical protein